MLLPKPVRPVNNNQKNKKKESSVDKDKNLKNEVVQKNASANQSMSSLSFV